MLFTCAVFDAVNLERAHVTTLLPTVVTATSVIRNTNVEIEPDAGDCHAHEYGNANALLVHVSLLQFYQKSVYW
jgi:hypothetical protein